MAMSIQLASGTYANIVEVASSAERVKSGDGQKGVGVVWVNGYEMSEVSQLFTIHWLDSLCKFSINPISAERFVCTPREKVIWL